MIVTSWFLGRFQVLVFFEVDPGPSLYGLVYVIVHIRTLYFTSITIRSIIYIYLSSIYLSFTSYDLVLFFDIYIYMYIHTMYHVHIYTYIWCNHTWKHMHANYNVCMCIIVYVHQFPCCDFPPPGSSSMLQTSSHRWSRKRKCWVMTGYFGCTTPWLGLRGRLVEPQPLNVFFCVSEKNLNV